MTRLPDDALVCRGGSCTAVLFAAGSGVRVGEDAMLRGVSVNAAAGKTLRELCQSLPNRKVGVSSVGAVRAAGGKVRRAPTSHNPFHCVIDGLTAAQAEALLSPPVANPIFETS